MKETAKAAVLVAPGKFEMREFPIPPIGDDEMLIKVEGCGVCGTDGHEYKRDPFNLCPVVLGHEGSGEIVKLGKDNFFHKDYQETLEPVYGNEVNPDDIVVEGGAV